MTFLLRKSFALIVVGVVCLILVIQFSGVLRPKPPVEIAPSLASSTISMGKNTTLTVLIENKEARQHSAEYRIVGSFKGDQLMFYDRIDGKALESVWNGRNYTIVYPQTWSLDAVERREVSVYVRGLDPKTDSATYTIFVEVWADKALSERRYVQLKVTRSQP